MKFDYTGAELFMAFLGGNATAREVLAHPAYMTIARHAKFCSNEISERDLEDALMGRPSALFGLEHLPDNLERIESLLSHIRQNEASWTGKIETALGFLFPGEDLNITVYPAIGYDMGIGMDGTVCMNCNCETYLKHPLEFLFYAMHESVHVVFGRHHRVPPLRDAVSRADWLSYFLMWTQNEGYAVYAPLHLREEMGCMNGPDYMVLSSPGELNDTRLMFLDSLKKLRDQTLTRDEYIDICFGKRRLTYRIGCEMIRQIELAYGPQAVQRAFRLESNSFFENYRHLIEK